jgi:transcription factor TGA
MLMQTLTPQLDPLTEQQVVGICNLQQSSQQAEEALSQGLDQLHQSLAETVAGGSPLDDPNVGSFMGHMAIALGQLSNLEGFVMQVKISSCICYSSILIILSFCQIKIGVALSLCVTQLHK